MDALAIIDTGMRSQDRVSSEKSIKKAEPQFGRVLNERRQVQQQADDRSSEPTTSVSEEQVQTRNRTAERPQEEVGQRTLSNEIATESNLQAAVEVGSQQQVEIPPPLIDLLQTLTQGALSETTENFNSSNNLLANLVQQLEALELRGEQMLAGVDLPILVAELQTLAEAPHSEELLVQLVTQLEEQFAMTNSLRVNGESVAAEIVASEQGIFPENSVPANVVLESVAPENSVPANVVLENVITENSVPTNVVLENVAPENSVPANVVLESVAPENSVPVIAENLTRIRQFLQEAVNTVGTRKSSGMKGVIAAEEVVVDEAAILLDETAEKIDPRFAALLKPRAEKNLTAHHQITREPVQQQNSRQPMVLGQSEADLPVFSGETAEQRSIDDISLRFDDTIKSQSENLSHLGQRQLQPQGQPPVAPGFEMNRTMAPTPMAQLPSGQQIQESQIIDQVVTQLSGSFNGESGRMVLRLQPAELGSLKLELMVEGDKIRANLHAQTQQVQEVLERNLPQLRNALTEQGLKIDQFQVNIDRNSDQQNQFDQLGQQQHNSENQPGWQQQEQEPEEPGIPLAHLLQNGGGGISLHV
ncbi:MAG: flagellar hook-length control protein FliK [Thermodesulfobacteriota bacterium]|nr:flagellar hook-length control protein FliK [Thermodesulfobacteriota bacterium]